MDMIVISLMLCSTRVQKPWYLGVKLILNFLGQIIDIAKQNGFDLDFTTVFTQSRPSAVTDGVTLTDTYTIFMSKE